MSLHFNIVKRKKKKKATHILDLKQNVTNILSHLHKDMETNVKRDLIDIKDTASVNQERA
jgi:hypothetical protein